MTDPTPHRIAIPVFAWCLLVNAVIGLIAMFLVLVSATAVSVALIAVTLTVPFLGVIAFPFVRRNHLWAFFVGLLFYAIQLVRYYSPSFNFAFISGIHFDLNFPSQDHAVSFNVLALVFLMQGAVAMQQRLTSRSTRTLRDEAAHRRLP